MAAHQVISAVKENAEGTGCTTVITIHQPGEVLFKMATSLALVSAGTMAYIGPVGDAVKHIATASGIPISPRQSSAEYLIKMVSQAD